MIRVFHAVVFALGAMAAAPAVALEIDMIKVRGEFERMIPFLRQGAQERMRDAGLYDGPLDGQWGPSTEAAYVALANSEVFEANVHKMRVIDIPEGLAGYPFAGEFSEGFLGIPFYEAGDDCDTCDFNEADLVNP